MSEASDKADEVSEQKTEDDLPQHLLEKYDSDHQVQLIKGYRILQVLLYYPSNKLFFEKPENEVLGSKCYYDVIEDPMWLHEIKKKFFCAEYSSLTEVIQDMRLIFENCYYFWGPKSAIAEQCLLMERQLESQLIQLPKDLKCMCTLEKTHGACDDEVVSRVWNRSKNRGKTCSNLMLRTWRRRRLHEAEISKSKAKLSNYCRNSRQIIRWELENLMLPDNYSTICVMQELPEIGLFLRLVENVFGLKSISQHEVECMLLMPQHSSAYRDVMAALLNIKRTETPLKYEDVTTELERRFSDWYTGYKRDSEDRFVVLIGLGVDMSFFELVGVANPLEGAKFEDLSYHQKAAIVKALCNNLMQVRSDIEELTTKKNTVQRIGQDRLGNTYLYCPSFLDFRLYKYKIQNEENTDQNTPDVDSEETAALCGFPKTVTDFEMVADSIEKLRCLTDDLLYTDFETTRKDGKGSNTEIVQALLDLDATLSSKEDDFIKVTNKARVKLFKEWRKSCGSDIPVIDDLTNDDDEQLEEDETYYDDGSEREASDDEDGSREAADVESECRRLVVPEGDVSGDDGERARRRKKKKKKKKKSRKRKARELSEALANEVPEDAVKTDLREKPDDATDDLAAFYATTEIKEEPPSDDSATSNRRRRSSVPTYSVYNETLFSDDSDSISPDEVYTSAEDSDDEWQIPPKRARNRAKAKVGRHFKAGLKGETAQQAGRRRGRHRKVDSETTANTEDENAAAIADADADVEADAGLAPVKEEPEIAIKEEVKMEPEEPSAEKSEEAGGDSTKEGDKPPPVKIKVIDFARLTNSLLPDAASSPAPLSPAVNAFIVRPGADGGNSLPVIRTAFSKVQPSPLLARQQSMMGQSAYLLSPNQQAGLRGPRNAALMARYPSPNMNVAAGIPRIVRAQSMNPAYHQQQQQQQLAPRMFKRIPGMKQIVRAPMNAPSKYYGTETTMMRKQPMPYERLVQTTAPIPKIGRNITVVPKTVQRRPLVREIEGMIGIHSDGGLMRYVVNLANGSHVPLSNDQVQKLREGNNGVLPQKLKIPVPADVAEKIEPCVVIDD